MEALVTSLKSYLSVLIGQAVDVQPRSSTPLAPYLAQTYALFDIQIGELKVLGIATKGRPHVKPAQFQKQLQMILKQLGLDPRLQFLVISGELHGYVRQRLIQKQIPFVVPGSQLYMPALGVAQGVLRGIRPPIVPEHLGSVTQLVLVAVLNGSVRLPIRLMDLAARLHIPRSTLSAAIAEIKARDLLVIEALGRERIVNVRSSRRELWEAVKPLLRSPVLRSVHVEYNHSLNDLGQLAGESALSRFSALAAPEEQVRAMSIQQWREVSERIHIIPVADDGSCLVQVWSYNPRTLEHGPTVDKFSLFASLANEPDERVQMELDRMMRDISW